MARNRRSTRRRPIKEYLNMKTGDSMKMAISQKMNSNSLRNIWIIQPV